MRKKDIIKKGKGRGRKGETEERTGEEREVRDEEMAEGSEEEEVEDTSMDGGESEKILAEGKEDGRRVEEEAPSEDELTVKNFDRVIAKMAERHANKAANRLRAFLREFTPDTKTEIRAEEDIEKVLRLKERVDVALKFGAVKKIENDDMKCARVEFVRSLRRDVLKAAAARVFCLFVPFEELRFTVEDGATLQITAMDILKRFFVYAPQLFDAKVKEVVEDFRDMFNADRFEETFLAFPPMAQLKEKVDKIRGMRFASVDFGRHLYHAHMLGCSKDVFMFPTIWYEKRSSWTVCIPERMGREFFNKMEIITHDADEIRCMVFREDIENIHENITPIHKDTEILWVKKISPKHVVVAFVDPEKKFEEKYYDPKRRLANSGFTDYQPLTCVKPASAEKDVEFVTTQFVKSAKKEIKCKDGKKCANYDLIHRYTQHGEKPNVCTCVPCADVKHVHPMFVPMSTFRGNAFEGGMPINYDRNVEMWIEKMEPLCKNLTTTNRQTLKSLEKYFDSLLPVHQCKYGVLRSVLNLGAVMSLGAIRGLWTNYELLTRLVYLRNDFQIIENAIVDRAKRDRKSAAKEQVRMFVTATIKFYIKNNGKRFYDEGLDRLSNGQRTNKEMFAMLKQPVTISKEDSDNKNLNFGPREEEEAIKREVVRVVDAVKDMLFGLEGVAYDGDEKLQTSNFVFAIQGPNYGNYGNGEVNIVFKKELMWHPDTFMTPIASVGYLNGWSCKWDKVGLDRSAWMGTARPWEKGGRNDYLESFFHPSAKNYAKACAQEFMLRAAVANRKHVDSVTYDEVLEYLQFRDLSASHCAIETHLPGFIPIDAIERIYIRDSPYIDDMREQLKGLPVTYCDDIVEETFRAFKSEKFSESRVCGMSFCYDRDSPKTPWFPLSGTHVEFDLTIGVPCFTVLLSAGGEDLRIECSDKKDLVIARETVKGFFEDILCEGTIVSLDIGPMVSLKFGVRLGNDFRMIRATDISFPSFTRPGYARMAIFTESAFPFTVANLRCSGESEKVKEDAHCQKTPFFQQPAASAPSAPPMSFVQDQHGGNSQSQPPRKKPCNNPFNCNTQGCQFGHLCRFCWEDCKLKNDPEHTKKFLHVKGMPVCEENPCPFFKDAKHRFMFRHSTVPFFMQPCLDPKCTYFDKGHRNHHQHTSHSWYPAKDDMEALKNKGVTFV